MYPSSLPEDVAKAVEDFSVYYRLPLRGELNIVQPKEILPPTVSASGMTNTNFPDRSRPRVTPLSTRIIFPDERELLEATRVACAVLDDEAVDCVRGRTFYLKNFIRLLLKILHAGFISGISGSTVVLVRRFYFRDFWEHGRGMLDGKRGHRNRNTRGPPRPPRGCLLMLATRVGDTRAAGRSSGDVLEREKKLKQLPVATPPRIPERPEGGREGTTWQLLIIYRGIPHDSLHHHCCDPPPTTPSTTPSPTTPSPFSSRSPHTPLLPLPPLGNSRPKGPRPEGGPPRRAGASCCPPAWRGDTRAAGRSSGDVLVKVFPPPEKIHPESVVLVLQRWAHLQSGAERCIGISDAKLQYARKYGG